MPARKKKSNRRFCYHKWKETEKRTTKEGNSGNPIRVFITARCIYCETEKGFSKEEWESLPKERKFEGKVKNRKLS